MVYFIHLVLHSYKKRFDSACWTSLLDLPDDLYE